MAEIYAYKTITPRIHEDAYLAPGAKIIGDVEISQGANIWYNATIRADVNYVRIGKYSNIQDNSVIHEDSGRGTGRDEGCATIVGDHVTVGHGVILHACTVEDGCLIGMGSVVLDGAVIGRGSVVGAGAVVLKNTVIPPFSVVVGSPARVIKTLPEQSYAEALERAQHYYCLAQEHKAVTGSASLV